VLYKWISTANADALGCPWLRFALLMCARRRRLKIICGCPTDS